MGNVPRQRTARRHDERDPDSKDETASTMARATKQKAQDELRASQSTKPRTFGSKKKFEAGTLRSREKFRAAAKFQPRRKASSSGKTKGKKN
jgi:hypothetical protein